MRGEQTDGSVFVGSWSSCERRNVQLRDAAWGRASFELQTRVDEQSPRHVRHRIETSYNQTLVCISIRDEDQYSHAKEVVMDGRMMHLRGSKTHCTGNHDERKEEAAENDFVLCRR